MDVSMQSKQVSVYICSTPEDTKVERRLLMDKVSPEMKTFCRFNYGIDFQFIDPYQDEDTSWPHIDDRREFAFKCILDCKEHSLSTSFLAIFGEKYGHVTLPETILADEFDVITSLLRLKESRELRNWPLLAVWYKVDNYAMPEPLYVLQKYEHINPKPASKFQRLIYGDAEADFSWNRIAEQLSMLLRRGIQIGFNSGALSSDAQCMSFFKSDFERQIQLGIGADSIVIQRCIVDARNYVKHECLEPFLNLQIDSSNGNVVIDKNAESSIKKLKESITDEIDVENMNTFNVLWKFNEGICVLEHEDYLNSLCEFVCERLRLQIHKSMSSSHNVRRLHTAENRLHWSRAHTMAREFQGQDELLDLLKSYTLSCDHLPLVLYGDTGVGKSYLIAKTACMARQWTRGELLVCVRFVKTTLESQTLVDIVRSLCCEISQGIMQEYTSVYNTDKNQLFKSFKHLLTVFPAHLSLVLLIADIDLVNQDMSWLPESLPENVKLIISTSQSPSSISESLGWTVPPVTNIASPTPSSAISPTPPHIGSDNLIRVMCRVQDTVAWFARALLTYSSRRMTDGQLACLQRLSPESPLVAWLTVGDLTTTGCRVEHRCLADAFAGVVNAARRRHGRSVVDAVLCFIDACGSGISDSEMVDVLTRYHTAADTDQYPGEERTTPVDSGVANSCARTAARNATKTLNGQAPSTPSTPTAVSTSRSSLVVSPPRRFSPFTWLYIRRSLYPLLSHTADGRTCWRCSALARQWNPPQSTCARAKSTASACTPTAAQRDAAHCTLADYFAGAVNSSSSAPTSRPQSCESTPSRSSRLTTPLAFTAPPSTPILPPIGAPDIPSYGKPKTSTATTTKVSRPLTPNSTPARPPSRTPPNSAAPRVRHAPKPPTQTHPLASTTTTIAPAITATTIATTSSSQEQVYQPAQPVLINDDPLIYNRRKLDELPLHLMASRRFSQLERYVLFDYDWMRARIYSKPSVQEGIEAFLGDLSLCTRKTEMKCFNSDTKIEVKLLRETLIATRGYLIDNVTSLAIELSGRLLNYYFQYPNLARLIRQCDTRAVQECGAVPSMPFPLVPGGPWIHSLKCGHMPTSFALRPLHTIRGEPPSINHFIYTKNKDSPLVNILDPKTSKKARPDLVTSLGDLYISQDGGRLIVVNSTEGRPSSSSARNREGQSIKIHDSIDGSFLGQVIPANHFQSTSSSQYQIKQVKCGVNYACVLLYTETSCILVIDLSTCEVHHVYTFNSRVLHMSICEPMLLVSGQSRVASYDLYSKDCTGEIDVQLDIQASFQFNSKCSQAFSHTDDALVIAIIENECQTIKPDADVDAGASTTNGNLLRNNYNQRQPRNGERPHDATSNSYSSAPSSASTTTPPLPPPPPRRKRLVRVQSLSANQRFIDDRVLRVSLSRDDRLVAIYGLHNILVYDARTELPAAHFGRPAHLPDEMLVDGVARSVGFSWVGLLRDRLVAVVVSSVYVWSVDGQQSQAKIRSRPGRIVQTELLTGGTGGCGGTRLITRTEGQKEFDVWSLSSTSLSSNSRQHSTPCAVTKILAIGRGGGDSGGEGGRDAESRCRGSGCIGDDDVADNNNSACQGEFNGNESKPRLVCDSRISNGHSNGDNSHDRASRKGREDGVCEPGALLALSIGAHCKAVAVHSIRLGSLVDLLQHDDFVDVLACSGSGGHVFTATRAQGNRAPKNRIWCLEARKVGREWSPRGALDALATPSLGDDYMSILERGDQRAFVTLYNGHVLVRRSSALVINELYSPIFLVGSEDKANDSQYMVAFGLRWDCSSVGDDNRAICIINLQDLDNYYITAGQLQESTGAVKLLMVKPGSCGDILVLYTCESLSPGVSKYDHCFQLARYDLIQRRVVSITQDLVTPLSCLDSILFADGFIVDESSHIIDNESGIFVKRVIAPNGATPKICILNGTALVYTLSCTFIVINIEDDRIISKVNVHSPITCIQLADEAGEQRHLLIGCQDGTVSAVVVIDSTSRHDVTQVLLRAIPSRLESTKLKSNLIDQNDVTLTRCWTEVDCLNQVPVCRPPSSTTIDRHKSRKQLDSIVPLIRTQRLPSARSARTP